MTNILITDTHFGVKQNSMTWFNSQSDFIYKQLIPHIKSEKGYIRLIHLGDVFDSRSTISVFIANKVRQIFKDIANVCDEIVVIAGNHDFYSPNSNEFDSLGLVLNDIPNVRLVRRENYFDGESLFIPWYEWDSLDTSNYPGLKNIFAHADIVSCDPGINNSIKVFSGHMHRPYFKDNRYNIGSCYSLDFSDSNSKRGFYIFNEDGIKFVPNNHSIRFYRLYNEDIFNLNGPKDWDYIELYISQSNMTKANYITTINELTKTYKNIWVIPQISENSSLDSVKFEGYDIESIIKDSIPEELQDKFNKIKERYDGISG